MSSSSGWLKQPTTEQHDSPAPTKPSCSASQNLQARKPLRPRSRYAQITCWIGCHRHLKLSKKQALQRDLLQSYLLGAPSNAKIREAWSVSEPCVRVNDDEQWLFGRARVPANISCMTSQYSEQESLQQNNAVSEYRGPAPLPNGLMKRREQFQLRPYRQCAHSGDAAQRSRLESLLKEASDMLCKLQDQSHFHDPKPYSWSTRTLQDPRRVWKEHLTVESAGEPYRCCVCQPPWAARLTLCSRIWQ